MNFSVYTIPPFDRQLKRLIKKYSSLKQEFASLINSLESEPKQGKSIGNNCYKIRLAIASKQSGKSGGARVIAHVLVENNTVFLISIYDKSEKESISDVELRILLSQLGR